VRAAVVVNLPPANVQPVRALPVSPDKSAVAAGRRNQIHVYDAGSGTYIRTLIDPNMTTPDTKPVQRAHPAPLQPLAYTPDGKFLASAGADDVVKIWDYEKGVQKQTVNAHTKQVTRLVFVGSKPEFITCSGDQQVKMWNVDNGGNTRNFAGGTDFLYAVGVS